MERAIINNDFFNHLHVYMLWLKVFSHLQDLKEGL